MTLLSLGVIGTSAKENEHRLPLHPEHLPHLDADLRARITLEHGYGEKYGAPDSQLAEHVGGAGQGAARRIHRCPTRVDPSTRCLSTSRTDDMETAEIRRRWLSYFESRGHVVVPSA